MGLGAGTVGAVILSNSTGPGNESRLTVSATDGVLNYALLVPASGGNVSIGNSAPSQLLSVGSTSQFTVDALGNVANTGNATTPTNLEWATRVGSYATDSIAADKVLTGACANLTGLTFTATAGSGYAVRITIIIETAASGTLPDVKLCKDIIDEASLWQVGNVNGAGVANSSPNDNVDETLHANMPLSTTKNLTLAEMFVAGSSTSIQQKIKNTSGTAVTTIKTGSLKRTPLYDSSSSTTHPCSNTYSILRVNCVHNSSRVTTYDFAECNPHYCTPLNPRCVRFDLHLGR